MKIGFDLNQLLASLLQPSGMGGPPGLPGTPGLPMSGQETGLPLPLISSLFGNNNHTANTHTSYSLPLGLYLS